MNTCRETGPVFEIVSIKCLMCYCETFLTVQAQDRYFFIVYYNIGTQPPALKNLNKRFTVVKNNKIFTSGFLNRYTYKVSLYFIANR